MSGTLNWKSKPSNIRISVVESTVEISDHYCNVFHLIIEDSKQCYSLVRFADDFYELDQLVHKHFPKYRITLPKLSLPSNHIKSSYSMRSLLSSIKYRKKKSNSELLEIYLYRCAFTQIGKSSLFHDFLTAQREEDCVSSKSSECQPVPQLTMSVRQTEDQLETHTDAIMTPYTLNRKKSFIQSSHRSHGDETSNPMSDFIATPSSSICSSVSDDSISFTDVATSKPFFPRYLDYYDNVDLSDNRLERLSAVENEMQDNTVTKNSIKGFQLIKVLGKGATGKVLLVRDDSSDKLYALKSITKSWTITQREINHVKMERDILATMADIRHPFLINLHAAFQDQHNLFLLLDYHAGADLATLLQRNIRFHPEQCRLYCAEILMGLQELHKNNILYRDLKPENVLLAADGHIVLTDFGLSKMFDDDETSSDIQDHRTSTFCGTPEYLAPEIILQEEKYSYATDYWSLGTMLYEMYTGMLPFGGNTLEEMYDRVLYDDLLFPANMDPEATDLIAGLLDRDPSTRLGAGPGGVFEIRMHPYFIRHFEWKDVYTRSIKPLYVPSMASATDLCNFDSDFLQMPVDVNDEEDNRYIRNSNYTPCELNESAFKGYSYIRIEEDSISYESEIYSLYDNYAPYDQDNMSDTNSLKDYTYDSESESTESYTPNTPPFNTMKPSIPKHHSVVDYTPLNCNRNIRNSLLIDSSVNNSTNITWIS
ncbi:kinase-like domain-containing protein [Pilobolus umbonatus]|nr:kinase-like domain-containing protein [Pilobolus umbonatus]